MIFKKKIILFDKKSRKINLSIKTLKRYKVKFSVQKNIKFSTTNKIANRLARAFKNFKILKF